MFVKNFMTCDIITVDAEEKAGSALQLMREQGLRRMPVVNAGGEIVGMITDRRLLQALAVPVRRGEFRRSVETPPSLTVGALMAYEVFTTAPDTLIEEAAALMAFQRGFPGGDGGRQTDRHHHRNRYVPRLLAPARWLEHGLRVTLRAPSFRGIQADLTDIARAGGNLINLANLTDDQGILMAFKVVNMTKEDIEAVLEAPGRRPGYPRDLKHETEVKPMIGTRCLCWIRAGSSCRT